MKEIGILILGWLLGIFSPIISDFFTEKRQRKKILAAVRIELRDLQFRLATSAFLLKLRHGGVTPNLVQWISEKTENYSGNEPTENVPSLLEKMKGLTQEQLNALTDAADDGTPIGSSLKTFEPTFLLSQISEFTKLPSTLQLQIHELLRRLSAINQEIPRINIRSDMTFDSSISEENHNALHVDLETRYIFIANTCKTAADQVDAVIKNKAFN